MIKLEKISKCFGTKKAVDGLTLSIDAGELFAFLGPNGAGKTTTIKMMVGLLFPTEGRIFIGGHDIIEDGLAAKELISYVPDQPYLYEKLSGREFLEFVGRIYRMDKTKVQAEIDRYRDIFEYGEYIDELSENYSHGMKQRVVLTAAFMHNPKVIIIDEPMVGLDPKSARILKELLKEKSENGCTVFFSTHTLAVAEELASSIGIIHKARLIAEGSVEDIRTRSRIDGTLEDIFLQLTREEGA
jgi:ABC-2 type transport system ATP-binding protein